MKIKLALFYLLVTTITTSAQHATDWIHYGEQRFGKVTFNLYAKRGSWGMGQQFYAANFYNGTSYKIKVEGELYANLTCGNEVYSKFNFDVGPYAEKTRVDPV